MKEPDRYLAFLSVPLTTAFLIRVTVDGAAGGSPKDPPPPHQRIKKGIAAVGLNLASH